MKSMKRILSITLLVSVAAFWSLTAAFAADVMTVLGPVPAEKLGVTLIHEHMAFNWPGSDADTSMAPFDLQATEERVLKVLNDVKAVGVNTIVDAGMNDTGGRSPIFLRNLAKKSGLNIIMATGLYFEREGQPLYFKYRTVLGGTNMEQEIYELFKKEITDGVWGTGIKAGIIKVASDAKMTDYEKVVFKAAVRAANETGVPIITHTQDDTVGPAQQRFFLSVGGNPKKIMIGHQNNSNDVSYHLAQLSKPGFYIGFDRCSLGAPWTQPGNEEALIELVKKGYANRIMLAHDSITYWPGKPFTMQAALKPAMDIWYPTYIHKSLIPKMKAAGVTDEQIKMMLVDNPRRFFNGE